MSYCDCEDVHGCESILDYISRMKEAGHDHEKVDEYCCCCPVCGDVMCGECS